jgi:hypothetical protein
MQPLGVAYCLKELASKFTAMPDEALAVEHVRDQTSISSLHQEVGRNRNSGGRTHLIGELDDGHLVRHRHQRTTNVRDLEQFPEETREVGRLDTIGATTASMPDLSKKGL